MVGRFLFKAAYQKKKKTQMIYAVYTFALHAHVIIVSWTTPWIY